MILSRSTPMGQIRKYIRLIHVTHIMTNSNHLERKMRSLSTSMLKATILKSLFNNYQAWLRTESQAYRPTKISSTKKLLIMKMHWKSLDMMKNWASDQHNREERKTKIEAEKSCGSTLLTQNQSKQTLAPNSLNW